MAEPLSFMHHDQGSSSERSDDSPSAVSEDDSSGHCGHISPPDPDWTEERFRVDRKKLETMLLAASEGRINGGEDFFQKVMDETNTQIAWPSKLKIGAKSKKGIRNTQTSYDYLLTICLCLSYSFIKVVHVKDENCHLLTFMLFLNLYDFLLYVEYRYIDKYLFFVQ
uniref:BICC1 first type I KH domain-containing protein n=1 Tax=Cyprinus carpio TaxID=7962 RepID=A0A8C1UNI8_CYPCA